MVYWDSLLGGCLAGIHYNRGLWRARWIRTLSYRAKNGAASSPGPGPGPGEDFRTGRFDGELPT